MYKSTATLLLIKEPRTHINHSYPLLNSAQLRYVELLITSVWLFAVILYFYTYCFVIGPFLDNNEIF